MLLNLPFYKAIEMVLTHGKAMCRSVWHNDCCILYLTGNTIKSSCILMNTGSEYIAYIPTAEDMISTD